ncbi:MULTISPECIES: XkdF-like putative serine protease domain-containing protein [Flavobacterium]|uniref:Phage-like element PBSX protein XkdF domain-containing protein n=1 Tax=Flavobacterium hankyongi TaxID=1176532 RepID=A0ABP8ZXT3_9FLAO|nr:XkdF-like putative serine protease domain-containing protein [Flavobacterium sp. N1846]
MKENTIFGAVLIPNKLILRAPNLKIPEYHNIVFSAETIKSVRENFHRNNFEQNVNINHDGKNISGVEIMESFIISETNRNILPNELSDLPNGTWVAKYLITNKDIWQMVQDGKLNGFSIEGIFDFVKFEE